MQFKIDSKILEDDIFTVTVGSESKTLHHADRQAEFELTPDQQYHIRISQQESKSNHSFGKILLNLLTLIFQGLMNIIMINIDSDWYKNKGVVKFETEFDVTPSKTSELIFSYTRPKYDKSINEYTRPIVNINCIKNPKVSYSCNRTVLTNGLFEYSVRMISIDITIVILMIAVLLIALRNTVAIALLLSGVVLFIGIVVGFLLIIRQKKLYNKILNGLEKQEGK